MRGIKCRLLAAAVVVERYGGGVGEPSRDKIHLFIQSYSKTLLYDDDMVHSTSNLISITAT
jgi:hypothetical protein